MQSCACGSSQVTIDLRTGSDGGPGGIMCKCQECGAQWPVEPFKPAAPAPVAATPVVSPIAKPIQLAATAQLEQPKTRRVTPRNLVSDAKRQIKALDIEIKRLEKLKRQRTELARLIKAAESNDGQVVAMRRANP